MTDDTRICTRCGEECWRFDEHPHQVAPSDQHSEKRQKLVKARNEAQGAYNKTSRRVKSLASPVLQKRGEAFDEANRAVDAFDQHPVTSPQMEEQPGINGYVRLCDSERRTMLRECLSYANDDIVRRFTASTEPLHTAFQVQEWFAFA